MNLCIIIPNYNHGATISALLQRLQAYDLACIIVDDGSDVKTKAQLEQAQQQFSNLEILTLKQNSGKGIAMQQGFLRAWQRGFTHALQIDADGQHDSTDIPAFIHLAEQQPQSLISGRPIFDNTIPKKRLYGRKITTFWVAVQTWSLQIPEAMCGFRIYPLEPTLKLMQKHKIGARMDFDIDILVRLAWANSPVLFVPTQVTYPPDGLSHFRMWKDNIRIAKLHFCLFFGMVMRSPVLLYRKLTA